MSDDELAEAAFVRADALIDLGRHDEALTVVHQALAQDPSDARLLGMASLAHLRLGHNQEAASTAARAIASDPEWDWLHRLRALALAAEARRAKRDAGRRLGRLAADAAGEATRLAPGDADAYCVLVEAHLAAGDLGAAGFAARRAVELAPDEAGPWVASSQVALAAGDALTAEAAARRALSIDPEDYAALNNVGAALHNAGRRREAAALFAAAARQDPNADTARENVALTGLVVLRIGALVLLVPLLALPGTRWLFWVAAIASNIYISRRPAGLAPLERWGTSVGLAVSRREQPRKGAIVALTAALCAIVFAFLTVLIGASVAAVVVAFVLPPTVLVVAIVAWSGNRRRRRALAGPVQAPVKAVRGTGPKAIVIIAVVAWTLTAAAIVGMATSSASPQEGGAVGPLVAYALVAVVTTGVGVRRFRAGRD